jgi:hypothetical protein
MAANPIFADQDRLSFVSSLELPDAHHHARIGLAATPAPAPAPTIKDGEQSTFIAGGSVVSFASGVSGQNQKDVLNSTLLAQLACDKMYDREKQITDWYKRYHSILENVGWVIQGFDFSEYKAAGDKFEADKAILEILAAVVSQNELLIIKSAIEAAKSLPTTDGRITLFDRFSSSGGAGSFQIGLATEEKNVVAMKLGAFLFSTKTNETRVLWFKFSKKDSSLSKSTQTVTLNSEVYAQVRDTVQQKLGEMAKTFVANLTL